MEIKLDAEAAATIASAAIFEQMSQESRDNVMKAAIEFLLTPTKDRNTWNAGQTPLQTAFNSALQSVAHRVVQEKIENDPEVKTAIEKLLGPMLMSALDGEAENWDSTLANKIGLAVGQWLTDCAQQRRDR